MCRCTCRARCCGPAIPTPAQGNGEVNLTAVETAYREFNITVDVIKGKPLDMPRIETPTSWITMGFDQDLNKAWDQAKAQTVKFLSEQRKISAEQAAKLMPTVSDCRVSQVVNIKKGIHCLNPKNAQRPRGHGASDQGDAALLRHATSRMPISTRRWTTRRWR